MGATSPENAWGVIWESYALLSRAAQGQRLTDTRAKTWCHLSAGVAPGIRLRSDFNWIVSVLSFFPCLILLPCLTGFSEDHFIGIAGSDSASREPDLWQCLLALALYDQSVSREPHYSKCGPRTLKPRCHWLLAMPSQATGQTHWVGI